MLKIIGLILGSSVFICALATYASADGELPPGYKKDAVPVVIISDDGVKLHSVVDEGGYPYIAGWVFAHRISGLGGFMNNIDPNRAIRQVPTSDSVELGFKGIMDIQKKLETKLNNQKSELESYVTQQLKDIKTGDTEAVILQMLADPKSREKLVTLLSPEVDALKAKIKELEKKLDDLNK